MFRYSFNKVIISFQRQSSALRSLKCVILQNKIFPQNLNQYIYFFFGGGGGGEGGYQIALT